MELLISLAMGFPEWSLDILIATFVVLPGLLLVYWFGRLFSEPHRAGQSDAERNPER